MLPAEATISGLVQPGLVENATSANFKVRGRWYVAGGGGAATPVSDVTADVALSKQVTTYTDAGGTARYYLTYAGTIVLHDGAATRNGQLEGVRFVDSPTPPNGLALNLNLTWSDGERAALNVGPKKLAVNERVTLDV